MPVVLLDDLGKFLYKKLKCNEDKLQRVRLEIEYKKMLMLVHEQMWIRYMELEMSEANVVYKRKYDLEVEILKLERDMVTLEERIVKYVYDR